MGIRAAWRWFAVILPPTWIVVLVFIVLGLLGMLSEVVRNAPGFRRDNPDPVVVVTCAAAFLWGVYRAIWLNPMLTTPYRNWLAQTPWRRGMPLPFGPALPAWQDFIALLLLAGWAVGLRFSNPLAPFMAYATAYCLITCIALTATKEISGFAVAFCLPALVPLRDSLAGQLIVLVVAVGASVVGLWRSLARFPWPDCRPAVEVASIERRNSLATSALVTRPEVWPELLGWPFAALGPLGPESEARAIGRVGRVSLSSTLGCLLVAWVYFCFVTAVPGPGRLPMLFMWFSMATAAIVVFRLVLMFASCMPPLTIPGQIATGRLIVPSYHRMLLCPFGTLLIACFVPAILRHYGAPFEVALPLSLFAVLQGQLLLGPELHRWRLTCAHRAAQPLIRGDASVTVQVK